MKHKHDNYGYAQCFLRCGELIPIDVWKHMMGKSYFVLVDNGIDNVVKHLPICVTPKQHAKCDKWCVAQNFQCCKGHELTVSWWLPHMIC